jgi:uridine kinase
MRIIGITGASGSGKSSIARALQHALALDGQSPQLSILPVDAYYRDLSFLTLNEREAVDFDDPSAIEFELLAEHLKALKRGKAIGCPRYDFATHSREIETEIIVPSPLLLVEGLLLGAWDEVLDHVDALIFVETPLDVCLDRRLRRDCEERGRTQASVIEFWHQRALPGFNSWAEQARAVAKIIISGELPSAAAATVLRSELEL